MQRREMTKEELFGHVLNVVEAAAGKPLVLILAQEADDDEGIVYSIVSRLDIEDLAAFFSLILSSAQTTEH